MKVLINGWFWGIDTAGSGQYLTQLLQAINGLIVQGDSQFIVIIPDGNIPTGQEPIFTPDGPVAFITTPLPKLPRQLAKLWWEQVTMPLAARQQGADLLWIPYWAAPYWQPVPTVVTIHDLIPRLLPEYRGGRLLRL